jgi:hypothetical protein
MRKWAVYTSELGHIRLCINEYHPKKERVDKLFYLLGRYRQLHTLYDLKKHHILVKHSNTTMKQLNTRIEKSVNIEDIIITEIKKLYYGNSN